MKHFGAEYLVKLLFNVHFFKSCLTYEWTLTADIVCRVTRPLVTKFEDYVVQLCNLLNDIANCLQPIRNSNRMLKPKLKHILLGFKCSLNCTPICRIIPLICKPTCNKLIPAVADGPRDAALKSYQLLHETHLPQLECAILRVKRTDA